MQGELVIAEPTLDELMDDLTDLQRRFVEVLIETPDVMFAYRKAGGKAVRIDTQQRSAYEILVNPAVQRVLRKIRKDRMERTLITSDWILNKLVALVERCMQGQPVLDSDGNETGVWKFDANGAAKALHLLMKHLGMFEKDNRQKLGSQEQYEAAMERLKQRGIDVSKARPLTAGN
jgi:phage terminase small subunit